MDHQRALSQDHSPTMTHKLRPALFLDRDGVINADKGFVARQIDFVWQDGIFVLVRAALGAGYVPVIVTNQSGIGRGLYTQADYEALTDWMLARFAAEGAPIARVYHCPFHPEAELPQFRAAHPWRKPQPGMLLAAAGDLELDLARSILIGDRWSDIGAGMAAGVPHLVIVGGLASAAAQDVIEPPTELVRCPDLHAINAWFVQHLITHRPSAR
jgi:D-glycero-D-manno-heptose 1,7-bisphosphate phosphatase